MNLKDIQQNISSKIYERGQEYFEDGCVRGLIHIGQEKWKANVEGNYDDYTVEIILDDKNNIKSWHCNCPYDGDVCKHVVAVLLAVKEELKSAKPAQKGKHHSPGWVGIIEGTPEKELREFMLGYAKKHREFRDELLINLSKAQKEINTGKYRAIIAQTFNTMSGRYGFIEYHDTNAALHPVHNMLEKAEEYLLKGNLHEAFSIAAAVAPGCLEALEFMDDSNGECGGAVNEAFETVDKIMDACNDTQLAGTIFDWLLVQVQNPDYDNYGCADELEPIFFHWANTPARIKQARQFIEEQLEKYQSSDDWSARYRLTKYLKYKTALLIKEGKENEANRLINENLHLSDFREMKIEEALGQNNYPAAIEHINAGILQAEKDNYPGIVHRFKDQLLDMYKKQKNTEKARKVSKELFYESRHSMDYYRIYKGTFETAEWPEKCEEIIRHLLKDKKKGYWGYSFQADLADIYIEEKMWDRLFDEVKQADRIEITDKYAKYLKEDYSEGLILLYKNSIVRYAENTGRNIYAEIGRYLKNMATLKGGKAVAKSLMQELLETYKNRRAMKDEFRKLNW
jgi:uncharacterized Zn finger protein